MTLAATKKINMRFDGFLPIIIDLETSGCISATDSILEIAAITLCYDTNGFLKPDVTFACQVEAFKGARLDPKSLAVTGINLDQPCRFALTENNALRQLFDFVYKVLQREQCRRAIMVGHNVHFDLSFIQSASERWQLKKLNPFHSFTCFDTATLSGLFYGITVLARAAKAAGIPFDHSQAHSAVYDAECTAQLFCRMVNRLEHENCKNITKQQPFTQK
jgi:ribonuclease T